MSEKNTPEKRFSTGAISATVWENKGKTKDGQETSFNTITLQRRYMDKKDGQWKSTNSLRINDLPKASLVLNKAYEHLVLRDNQQQTESDELVEEEIVM